MNARKILIAHDFSETSDRALRFAATLATETGAQLALVYVMPDIYNGRGEPELALPPTTPGQVERYMRFLQEELQRAAHRALPDLAGTLTCHALRGDPATRIEALAVELGADIVCLGATGKGAVARVLLGSVSQAVLRTSTVPVLLVP